jgi:hypothetical protein
MKKLILIALMLVGLSIQAQTYLKKSSRIKDGDTTQQFIYEYDENFFLTEVTRLIDGDTIVVKYYQNDTLVQLGEVMENESHTIYKYYEDSVGQFTVLNADTTLAVTYHLDEQDRLVHIHFHSSGYINDIYQVWEEQNIFQIYWTDMNGSYTEYNIEYSSYLNPLYQAHRYIQMDLPGSYNYPDKLFNQDNEEIRYYDVVESIGVYPVLVSVYGFGNHMFDMHYEYMVVTDIPELPSEPYTVLSVRYFDLMGREIPKPTKGFYIERKVTDKGIISTKHFAH